MSVKIIIFGDSDAINTTLTTLRCSPFEEGEQIRTLNLQAGLVQYLLFIVKDIALVVSQSAGTSGLICLFSQKNVHELKQQTSSIISKAKQLQGIPFVMAISTPSKGISLRQIMSQLEQLKTKDRLTLIKQIDVESKVSIESILQWISAQRVQVGFDAQPRVVKAKAKYRQQPEQNKTYEALMKDKKFKAMSAINQQAKYLAVEKERIKQINMKQQLSKFTKNKQKMTPYDIKPSPNPRIEPNLNFFLKDIRDDKPNQVSIKIQTDQFKPKPPSPRYVPKKTGIDCSTQVQDNELFDFERQVEPILNVLTMRTLEEAVLDIQEQQQMFKMTKFRELYEYKKRQEKNLHRQYLLAQQQIIRRKQEFLQKRKARHQNKLNIFKKVQAFKISGQLTNKMYDQTLRSLGTMGFIPNELHHQLNTDYLNHLLVTSSHKLEKIQSQTVELQNFFDKDVIEPLLKVAEPRKQQRLNKIQKAIKRRINRSSGQRVINLFFNNEPTFNNFALNFSQHFDGTQEEYQKSYIERLKQLEGKVATGQVPEDSVQKFKKQQLSLLIKERRGLLLNPQTKYSFVLAHNQFEPTQPKNQYLSLKILSIDENGELVQNISSTNFKSSNFEYDTEIRDYKSNTSMDIGFSFDLSKLDKIQAVLFAIKISNLDKLSKPQFADLIKHSSYGFQTTVNGINIIEKQIKQYNVIENYKPQEQKQDQENEGQTIKNCWIIPFVLINNKKVKGWYLQTLDYLSKPMNQTQQNEFASDLVHYYRTCQHQQKQSQEQDQIQEQPKQKKSSRQGKRDRRKSNKEQEKKVVVVQQPVEVVVPLVAKMFPDHLIDFQNGSFEQVNRIFEDEVNGNEQILKNYPYGYHFRIRGKPFEQLSQLMRYRKVGDLTIESNPEPVVQSSKLVEEEQVEHQNEQDQ